ncbi:MAG: hypothetical protein FWD65_06125 [Coriobacteriia bacterium]|nr:hypothetical protein [Coriobacteriia bacterium]
MELSRTNKRDEASIRGRRARAGLRGAGRSAWRALCGGGLRLRCSLNDESGQGVAEYVIILAVIVVAAIILAVAFHDQLAAVWQNVTSQLGDLA